MSESFTHLHVHTEFSMLDGAARVDELVAAAVADGQPAIGITDHGNMYGVLDFYKACRAQGITPIIGVEAYMAHESRARAPGRRGRIDDTGGDAEGGRKLYYHLTLLAENNVGYSNLIQLVEPGVPRGLLLQAPGRLGAARATTTKASSPPPAASAATCCRRCCRRRRARRHGEGRPAAGHLRARQPVRRAAGPRHPRAAPHQPAAARDRPQARRAAARHQRQPLHPPRRRRGPRRAAVRADRLAR